MKKTTSTVKPKPLSLRTYCQPFLLTFGLACSPVSWADNLFFDGVLTAEPCLIPPGEENIVLDFGTVIDKYIYLNQRTNAQKFEIHLAECDLTQENFVKIIFKGIENSALPGYLALDAGSLASGIAIGLETDSGNFIPLNQLGSRYPLNTGDTYIRLGAHVRGEPNAITNKTLERGPFSATTIFSLEYE